MAKVKRASKTAARDTPGETVPPNTTVRKESAPPTAEEIEQEPNRVRRWLNVLGPGLVTGAADDDPAGVATYISAGATFGFATLWTALISFPLMSVVHFISAKIGMATGRGLTATIRERYSPLILYPAVFGLVIANTLNAGADIGAIAAALNLIVPIPRELFIVPVALALLALQIWGSYDLISKTFKWLALALLAFVVAAFFAQPNWGEVARNTFVPTIRLDAAFVSILVAIFGTTISPYLWFWQSAQEVEEEVARGKTTLPQRVGTTDPALKYRAWDIQAGALLSNVVMYFIILTAAATLFTAGETEVETAADAARALEPLAGAGAKYLLAIGLIGGGVLAVPVLTGSAAYGLAEAFSWKASLHAPPTEAKHFYFAIAGATIAGLFINFIGLSPVDALVYSALLNGMLAPPLLVLIMLVSSNSEVMGDRVNGRLVNVLGWSTVLLMAFSAVALVVIGVVGS